MTEQASHADEGVISAGEAVLVIGASFAGLTSAWWFNRLGFRVTLVELAPGLRRGGTPVDIEGAAVGILDRMGLLADVRARALPPRRFEFKDANDQTLAAMPAEPGDERLEIHRDDLLDILFAAVEGLVEIVFARSVVALDNGSEGVAVTFDDGSRRCFALVLGCDGNRSRTRRLAFGDGDYSHFMGGYFCIKVVPQTGLVPPDVTQVFSLPGRTALLNGYTDRTDVALAFRTDREISYDHRDRALQRCMIDDRFADSGWKIPTMLAHLVGDDDFYFDRINQIRMPIWSTGRVALVGDAGYCVSPMAGMGGSMAIIGAAALADALERHWGNHEAAFRSYHSALHPFVEEVQVKAATTGMATMFPADDAELTERNRKISTGELDL